MLLQTVSAVVFSESVGATSSWESWTIAVPRRTETA